MAPIFDDWRRIWYFRSQLPLFHESSKIKNDRNIPKRAFESLNRCLITLELQRVVSMTLNQSKSLKKRDIESVESHETRFGSALLNDTTACKMIQKQPTDNFPTQINNRQCQMELFLVVQVGTYVRKCFFRRLLWFLEFAASFFV